MYKKKERTNYCACCTKLKYFETGVCSHSSQPRLDRVEVLKLLKEYFPDETAASNNLHSYYTCLGSCTQLSENERGRMKKQKDKFQGGYLKKALPFRRKQACGGFSMWKDRACFAFFAAYTTLRTLSTKIPNSTASLL